MNSKKNLIRIICITCIILLLLIIIMLYSNVITQTNNIGLIGHTQHFKRYMDNISNKLYVTKINIKHLSKKLFVSTYLSLLKNIPHNKKPYLDIYTKAMRQAFLNNNLSNIANTTTNYIMSDKNMEMNMPYTLDNYIVFNHTQIQRLTKHIDRNILETLIHEKLHIIQRLHQQAFNTFYKSYYPFLYTSIPIEDLPQTLKDKHMTNPDNNFDLWLYKINNRIYIPILEKTNKGLQEYAYEYKHLHNRVLLHNILKYSSTSQSHPNELFAHEVAEQIMNTRLHKPIYNFLKTLKC